MHVKRLLASQRTFSPQVLRRPVRSGIFLAVLGLAALVLLSACDGQPQPDDTPAPTRGEIVRATAVPAPTELAPTKPAPTAFFSEREALVALYRATNGPGWKESENWLTGVTLDHWHGVSVDHSGSVIGLRAPGQPVDRALAA